MHTLYYVNVYYSINDVRIIKVKVKQERYAEQGKQYNYNVTLRRVRLTFLPPRLS
jgi:hypothetical protein